MKQKPIIPVLAVLRQEQDPVPVEEQNLNFMVNLGRTFGLPYGLSDHHDGDEMLYAATALGASIVEKGVTPEKYLADQDCAHAMFIDDIPEILKRIKNISKSYYPPRSIKVLNLIEGFQRIRIKKCTLGGCIFEKKKNIRFIGI